MALVHNNYPATNASPMETSVRMSASTTPSGGSRLAQMQARFQQKQLQEKEQKLLRLYESQQQRAFQRVAARGSAGSSSNNSVSSTTSSFSVGKVRQMFDERRVNGSTGWDRSYPLEPLDASLNKSRTAPLPSINKTKANRVASLDRSQNNYNQQISKTNVKRSKSQVRGGGIATELNGSYRKQNSVDSDYNASFRKLTVEEERNGSYRKVNNTERFTESFRIQPEEENLYDGYHNDRIDGHDGNYRKQNTEILNGSIRKQELNNSRVYQRDNYEDDEEEDQQFNGNQTFTVIDDPKREDLFAKYNIRDEENNELLSTSPPPELYNDDELDDSFVFKKLPNVGGALLLDETSAAKNSDKFKTYNASKQNKKMSSPAATEVKKGVAARPVRRESVSPPAKAASKPKPRKPENKVTSPPAGVRRPAAVTVVKQNSTPQTKSTTSSNMQKTPAKKTTPGQSQPQRPSSQQSTRSAAKRGGLAQTQDDLAECKVCQRRFTIDRIEKHESICRRASSKKRKVFDATKHRVSGTEAEPYLKYILKKKPDLKTKSKKDDWRKKHEDFIMTIRAAKEAQAHVRAGGNLRDLPPPPPLDTSDYIQCPHCTRKFNQTAAERHIPRCATMLHNKPKPAATGGARKRI